MEKFKEMLTKAKAFIIKRKGYCMFAAALIVLFVVGAGSLNIETVQQHESRKNAESDKRKELLAQLETEEEKEVSKQAVSEEAASGQAIEAVSTEDVLQVQDNGMTAGETAESPVDLSENTTDSQMGVQNSSENTAQNQASDTAQNQSEIIAQNSSQTTTQNQSGTTTQNATQSTVQSSNTNEDSTQSTAQNSNTGQNASQNTSQDTTQNQNSSADFVTEAPEESDHEEKEYIVVSVKIVCDKVLNNPDLSTAADIPVSGIMFEGKTVIEKNQSVLDALKSVCADNNIAYVNKGSEKSGYISSIGGLSEKDCGKYSGWKYKVNETVSGKAAGAYKLNENDEVIWYYVTNYME